MNGLYTQAIQLLDTHNNIRSFSTRIRQIVSEKDCSRNWLPTFRSYSIIAKKQSSKH